MFELPEQNACNNSGRKSVKYFIRNMFHDWSEVDRVTFDRFKEEIRQRYIESTVFSPSEISEDDFIKRFTKTEEEK